MSGPDDLAARKAEVRRRFEADRGFWSPLWDPVLELDPEFVEAYNAMTMTSHGRGRIEAKARELMGVAVNVTAMHLYEPGARIHMSHALEVGATPAELMEVLELATLVGVQGSLLGMRALAALAELPRPEDADRDELEQRFRAAHGYWNEDWAALLEADPEYFAAYLRISAHVAERGALEPKVRDFVLITINIAVTHLNEAAARAHIASALAHGATREEIADVIVMVGSLGVHGLTFAAPILADEVSKFEGSE